jgi:hypothetical protein
MKADIIIIDEEEHKIGDVNCKIGWCDKQSTGYPKECKCGGLIHATFLDESYDGYELSKACDKCGNKWVEE